MLPCFVCGKDAGTGWIQGFPPAPDSQKLALCQEHDSMENRLKVAKAWQEMLEASINQHTENKALQAGENPQLLSLYFVGGGSLSLPCSTLSVVEPNSLKITTQDGKVVFFPLQQVRNYALTPLYKNKSDNNKKTQALEHTPTRLTR